MEYGDGFDILCPFGGQRVVLVDGIIHAGEVEETEEERDEVTFPADDNTSGENPTASEQYEPDLDDLADGEDAISNDRTPQRHEAWLAVDNAAPQKRQHKATILCFYSSPLTVAQSKDRLKRVRGFSQFDECT